MGGQGPSNVLTLSRGGVCSLDVGSEGIFVRCESGIVWLSDGRGGDHVLEAGQGCAIAGRTRIVFEALGPDDACVFWVGALQESAPRGSAEPRATGQPSR